MAELFHQLLGIFFLRGERGIQCVIAATVTKINAGFAGFDVNLTQLSTPVFVFRIVRQSVVRGTIVNAASDACLQIVLAGEGLASSPLGYVTHGGQIGNSAQLADTSR